MSPTPVTTPPGLRQSLGLTHATAMVVGTIIGASIFAQPSEIAQHVPTGTGILLVWLGAGILTLFGALICAELTSAFPKTGGVYVFLKESWGAPVGFLWGWAMLLGMHTAIISIVATIFARYAGVLVQMDPTMTPMLAVAVILLLSAVNYLGVKHGGLVQNVFTGAKLIAIVAIIVAGFLWSGTTLPATPVATGGSLRPFFLAVAAALFAYGGWHMVTYTAGETRQAGRTVPRALLFGTLIVTLAYAGLNTIYLHVLPLGVVQTSKHVAADAADVVLGGGGASLMAVLVMVSTFGAANGIILVGPRVYYSMAQDGLLFRWLGAVHPVHGTPGRAIAVQAAGASALALMDYTSLVARVIYTEWIFFAIMAAGLLRLRGRPGYQPAYRIWGAPALATCFIIGSLVVVAVQILEKPVNSAIGLGMVLAGLPVYLLWSQRSRRSGP